MFPKATCGDIATISHLSGAHIPPSFWSGSLCLVRAWCVFSASILLWPSGSALNPAVVRNLSSTVLLYMYEVPTCSENIASTLPYHADLLVIEVVL